MPAEEWEANRDRNRASQPTFMSFLYTTRFWHRPMIFSLEERRSPGCHTGLTYFSTSST